MIDDAPPVSSDAPSTIFPGLYDGSPGERPAGEDITGVPLPGLTPAQEQAPEPLGNSYSTVPGAAPPMADLPRPQGPSREAAAEIEAPRPRKGRTLQDRIDTLTRQRREAESRSSGLEAQMQQLMSLVAEQKQQINELGGAFRAPRAATPAANDPLGLGDGAAPPAQPTPAVPFSLKDVESVVERAIGSYEQKARQNNAAAQALMESHEASFAEAVEEFPELADQRTRARKLFNQIYATSDLKPLLNAPYQIALQVRGLLAAEGGDNNPATVAERKRQATVVAPRPAPTDVPQGGPTASMRQRFDHLQERIRQGDTDFRTYKEWRHLREHFKPRPNTP